MDALGAPRALTSASKQVVWSAFLLPNGEARKHAAADSATGATVSTSLRLPGQYDEKLLSSIGLQGPYYNWNRWYLPGVGRYLEPDPIALAGGFNSPFGVDWYGYTSQNPLRWVDPMGLWTAGLGTQSAVQAIWGVEFTWLVVIDGQGNAGLALSPAGRFGLDGAASTSPAVSFNRQYQTASQVGGPFTEASVNAGLLSAGISGMPPKPSSNYCSTTPSSPTYNFNLPGAGLDIGVTGGMGYTFYTELVTNGSLTPQGWRLLLNPLSTGIAGGAWGASNVVRWFNRP